MSAEKKSTNGDPTVFLGVYSHEKENEGEKMEEGTYQYLGNYFERLKEESSIEETKPYESSYLSEGGIFYFGSKEEIKSSKEQLHIPDQINEKERLEELEKELEELEIKRQRILQEMTGISKDNSNFFYTIRFQELMEMEESNEKYLKLSEHYQDFVYAVQTFGKIIISERHLSNSKKTIKSINIGGVAGGDKYIFRGILFKYALDNVIKRHPTKGDFWMYGGFNGRDDVSAMKAAGNELKALIRFCSATTKVKEIHVPLMAIVDFHGYRLIAISLLPVTKNTLIYGSANSGHTVKDDSPEFAKKMKEIAELTNIKGHQVSNRFLYSPGDVEGHLGLDGRWYCLDFGRYYPPEGFKESRKIFYQLLRPELVRRYHVPLCSDSFTQWQAADPNKKQNNLEIEQATKYLHEKIIPEFSEGLDSNTIRSDLLGDSLHSFGINVRHMGEIRSHSKNKYIRELLLTLMWVRIVRKQLYAAMRNLAVNEQTLSEVQFKSVIIRILNAICTCDTPFYDWYWTSNDSSHENVIGIPSFKHSILSYFGSTTLNEEEQQQKLDRHVIFQLFFWSLEDHSSINFSASAKEFSRTNPRKFRLVEPDIISVEPRVKHMSLANHYEALYLYKSYSNATQINHEVLRSLEAARDKMRAAWASNADDPEILSHFAELNQKLADVLEELYKDTNESISRRIVSLREMAEDNFYKAEAQKYDMKNASKQKSMAALADPNVGELIEDFNQVTIKSGSGDIKNWLGILSDGMWKENSVKVLYFSKQNWEHEILWNAFSTSARFSVQGYLLTPLGICTTLGHQMVVFEDGRSLSKKIGDGVPLDDAFEIASCISFIHSKLNVAHTDLNGYNFFVGKFEGIRTLFLPLFDHENWIPLTNIPPELKDVMENPNITKNCNIYSLGYLLEKTELKDHVLIEKCKQEDPLSRPSIGEIQEEILSLLFPPKCKWIIKHLKQRGLGNNVNIDDFVEDLNITTSKISFKLAMEILFHKKLVIRQLSLLLRLLQPSSPDHFASEMVHFVSFPWFRGNLTKSEAEHEIIGPGYFLVRLSQTLNSLALAYYSRSHNRVVHSRIQVSIDGSVQLGGKSYPDIQTLMRDSRKLDLIQPPKSISPFVIALSRKEQNYPNAYVDIDEFI